MHTEIISSSLNLSGRNSALLPLPELPITVRLGTNDDIAFIDELQKKNNRNLGFLHRGTLQGKIKLQEVLIAEELRVGSCELRAEPAARLEENASVSGLATHNSQLATKLGYLIGNDRYFKRDELGAIFQLCVVPSKQRGLIGATLLKALFERASYGCKLYCCWCAKDLEANHFWEAMGFIPVAFRSGSRNKVKNAEGKRVPRVHIFWQKRIRAGDNETPLWYPSQTGGGAMNEDRIVLPIPPGVHWSEVESVVLPGQNSAECCVLSAESEEKLISPSPKLSTKNSALSTKAKRKPPAPAVQVGTLGGWGIGKKVETVTKEKPKREKPIKVKQKNDPKLVKASRELRDRYLEEINQNPILESHGKYEVSRMVEQVPMQKQIGRETGVESDTPMKKLLAA